MRIVTLIFVVLIFLTPSVWAGVIGNAVEVNIMTDNGRRLPIYPVKIQHSVRKVYAEAVKGDHYRIEVKNRLNRRVGLVIAVDGRNIISGNKSWLKNNERMYILEPYCSGEFAGWRSAHNRINRFYFTDIPDSYAAAFGDESAMGVIAVAVYPEIRRCALPNTSPFYPSLEGERQRKTPGMGAKGGARDAAPSSSFNESQKKSSTSEQKMESAGTGYGREEYSPSRIVAFEPENRAMETIYLKYEWRATLCKLGVIACAQTLHRPPNRLWDDCGYAPPPPNRLTR